jgi:hypothetical protein
LARSLEFDLPVVGLHGGEGPNWSVYSRPTLRPR